MKIRENLRPSSKEFYYFILRCSPVKPLYLYDALQRLLVWDIVEICLLGRAGYDFVVDVGEEIRLYTHVPPRVCKFIRRETRLCTRVAINDPGYFAPPPNQGWWFRSRGRCWALHLEVRFRPSVVW